MFTASPAVELNTVLRFDGARDLKTMQHHICWLVRRKIVLWLRRRSDNFDIFVVIKKRPNFTIRISVYFLTPGNIFYVNIVSSRSPYLIEHRNKKHTHKNKKQKTNSNSNLQIYEKHYEHINLQPYL